MLENANRVESDVFLRGRWGPLFTSTSCLRWNPWLIPGCFESSDMHQLMTGIFLCVLCTLFRDRVCHERLCLSLLTLPHLCAPWHRSFTLAATRAHWWTWPLARSHTLKKKQRSISITNVMIIHQWVLSLMLFEFTFTQIMSLSVCLITHNTLGKIYLFSLYLCTLYCNTTKGKWETHRRDWKR